LKKDGTEPISLLVKPEESTISAPEIYEEFFRKAKYVSGAGIWHII
jgi:hypothetical protein